MKSDDRKIGELKADRANPRKISPRALAGLSVAVKDYGDLSGIVWNEKTGELVTGHQRMTVLQKHGAKTWTRTAKEGAAAGFIVDPKTGERFPIRIVHWDKKKQRQANVIANNTEITGDFTKGILAQLEEMERDMPSFAALGLDRLSEQLEKDLRGRSEMDTTGADDVVMPKKPRAKLGDLWLLGANRLLCGDSTDPEQVKRLLGGRVAVLMNTDAPYGVDYAKTKAGMIGGVGTVRKRHGDIGSDELTGTVLQAFIEAAIKAALPSMSSRAAYYFWHPMLTQGTFFAAAAAAAAADILIHRQIIWVKPSFVLTRSGMYHWRHELSIYGWVKGNKPKWYGPKDQDTVWEVAREGDGDHPTQKPIELFLRPMRNHTRPGEVVYEPFSGSGSQIMAAAVMNRVCCAMELEPKYVDVAIARWEKFTSKKAVLSSR